MQRLATFLIHLLLFCGFASAQVPDGPGGVGNTSGTSTLRVWLRPETGVTLTSGLVSAWADQSGYGNNLSSPAGFRPLSVNSSSLNNQPVIRYSGAEYFSSGLTGPGVNDMTLFLTCHGSSYQSLFRFQNTAGTYLVYPWEFGSSPRTFISSSDGGTGSGVVSGLMSNVNNVGGARYERNTTNGMQTFLNGGVNAQRTSVNSALPSQTFYSGRYNPGTSEYANCDVGDLILFYTALNDVQMIIVQNYLAAKYNVALTSNDLYTMDNSANGNYDFDVAGIGRISGSVNHTDAQGAGIVRISNPTGLGNGDYYFWGHDNGLLGPTTADCPVAQGVQARLTRVWRGSETGAITSFNVRFDLTGLGPVTTNHLRLLIDTDNDGSFADETTAGGGILSGASSIGGNVYQFTAVTGLNNTIRFTLGTTNSGSSPLPIKLLEFSAAVEGDVVNILWKTASEHACDYFALERSYNGLDFATLVKVPSKAENGTSSTVLSYSASDAGSQAGIRYYRLLSVDLDGSVEKSRLVSVNYTNNEFKVVAFYDPHSAAVYVSAMGLQQAEEIQITVTDCYGKQIFFANSRLLNADENTLCLNQQERWASGVYFFQIRRGEHVHKLKMVVD